MSSKVGRKKKSSSEAERGIGGRAKAAERAG